MKSIRRQVILIIATFVFVMSLCGAVAATNSQGGPETNINQDTNFSSTNSIINESTNSTLNQTIQNDTAVNGLVDPRVLIIHSIEGTRMTNAAAHIIYDKYPQYNGLINITVRSTPQIDSASQEDLENLLGSSDIIILEYVGPDQYNKILKTLNNKTTLLNSSKIFLLLDGSSGIDLVKMSQINGKKVFDNVSDADVTQMSGANRVLQPLPFLQGYVDKYPQISGWAKAAGYYCYRNVESYANQIIWGMDTWAKYNNVPFNFTYGDPVALSRELLYRDGKFYQTLEDYLAKYPIDKNKPTVGIIEAESNMLGGGTSHYDMLIKKLVEKNYNIISVQARYGANAYSAMVRFFTTAPDITSFENNSSKYSSRIDIMVSFSTYLLGGTYSANVTKLLTCMNITAIRGMVVNTRTVSDWEVSQDGLLPWSRDDMVGQIAFAETQGLVEPILIAAAEYKTDSVTGAYTYSYVAIPDRIQKLADRISNWIQLKYLPNKDKKITLIYYDCPPGKQNIGSSYLNVPASILEILKRLKSEGYNVGTIPGSVEELQSLMLKQGINVANWAPGELEKLANNPNVILWDAAEYQKWFETLDPIAQKQVTEGPVGYIDGLTQLAVEYINKGDPKIKNTITTSIDKWAAQMKDNIKTYPEKSQKGLELLNSMVSSLKGVIAGNNSAWNTFYPAKNAFLALAISGLTGWGQSPGNIMTVTRNGKKYIVIPGIRFGNVFIGPEPQRGFEDDIAQIYHNDVVPPTHQYLAWYAWISQKFHSNAMVHVGLGSTYEKLPTKQVALSKYDFSDIVVGNIPSIQLFRVDNAADGLMAKRRALTVIIGYLTSPLKTTALYGGLLDINGYINSYLNAQSNEDIRKEYANSLRNKVKELHLEGELNITNLTSIADDDLVNRCSKYLVKIEQKLMPYGLHTFGTNWSNEEISLMVSSMISVDGGVNNPSLQRLLSNEMGWNYDNITPTQLALLNNQTEEWVLQMINGTKTPIQFSANPEILAKLNLALGYANNIKQSTNSEMNALITALSAGYVVPELGGDPVQKPSVLPTGKNLYTLDPTNIPTQSAYKLGVKMVNMALSQFTILPEKIAAVIWGVDTARDDGAMVSFILNMMGVTPTWKSGQITGVAAIPLVDLNHPRIDSVITISGLFRDVYGQAAILLDRGFRCALAASYNTIQNESTDLRIITALDAAVVPLKNAKLLSKGNDSLDQNYVAKHWLELTQKYINAGMDPTEAGNAAILRIFAPPMGTYGTGVKEAIEHSWTNDTDKLADIFFNRMGNSYSETGWGLKNVNLLKDILSGASTVFQSRSSNLVTGSENDDMADYLGGLSLSIKELSGNYPSVNIIDISNSNNPSVMSLKNYLSMDLRVKYLNPDYIAAMMSEGQPGANRLSTGLTALLMWQTSIPGSVDSYVWDEIANTYLKDQYNTGITTWLSSGNRVYDMMSISGTLLNAAYRKNWKVDKESLKLVANSLAKMVVKHGVSCDHHVCGDVAMVEWAMQYVDADIVSKFKEQMYTATNAAGFAPEPSNPSDGGNPSPGDSGDSSDGGSSPGTGSRSDSSPDMSVSEEYQTPTGEQSTQKSYEVSKASNASSTSSNIPFYAIIGLICLLGLIGFGYFKGVGRN